MMLLLQIIKTDFYIMLQNVDRNDQITHAKLLQYTKVLPGSAKKYFESILFHYIC